MNDLSHSSLDDIPSKRARIDWNAELSEHNIIDLDDIPTQTDLYPEDSGETVIYLPRLRARDICFFMGICYEEEKIERFAQNSIPIPDFLKRITIRNNNNHEVIDTIKKRIKEYEVFCKIYLDEPHEENREILRREIRNYQEAVLSPEKSTIPFINCLPLSAVLNINCFEDRRDYSSNPPNTDHRSLMFIEISGLPEMVLHCSDYIRNIAPSLSTWSMPSHWSLGCVSNAYVLVEVESNSLEWNNVLRNGRYTESLPIEIQSIKRIENFNLYRQYAEKRKNLVLYKQEAAYNEMWLWHGTSALSTDCIAKEGFDFRLAKRTGRWGTGTYFTDSVLYATGYSKMRDLPKEYPDIVKVLKQAKSMEDQHKYGFIRDNLFKKYGQLKVEEIFRYIRTKKRCFDIILAQVAVGRVEHRYADPNISRPSDQYDSVCGTISQDRNQGNIHIIYDFHQAYPAYIISFNKQQNFSDMTR